MKKIYEKPAMQVEEFVATNYCAGQCGEHGTTWFDFQCDAPLNGNHYSQGQRWDDVYWWSQSRFSPLNPATNYKKFEDYVDQQAYELGLYHPCGVTHPVSSENSFYFGFVDRNNNERYDSGEGCVIWRGDNGRNIHCTTVLKHEDWETLKS